MSKTIKAFDDDLKRRLLSIDEADIAKRCRSVPAKARTHAAIEQWTFARPHALAMLAAFEPQEASFLADAWLRRQKDLAKSMPAYSCPTWAS